MNTPTPRAMIARTPTTAPAATAALLVDFSGVDVCCSESPVVVGLALVVVLVVVGSINKNQYCAALDIVRFCEGHVGTHRMRSWSWTCSPRTKTGPRPYRGHPRDRSYRPKSIPLADYHLFDSVSHRDPRRIGQHSEKPYKSPNRIQDTPACTWSHRPLVSRWAMCFHSSIVCALSWP